MSDPLAVRLRSGFSTHTEHLQAAQLIDGLADENAKLVVALSVFAGLPETSEAETAVPNDSPVTIRCQLGDVRRALEALGNNPMPREPYSPADAAGHFTGQS